MQDHLILAIDAAGHSCSVALGNRLGVLASEKIIMQHGQATALIPMIDAVMKRAGHELAGLTAIAVGNGPGGFTGLRIALATARGLALALSKPLWGISNFQAAAAHIPVSLRPKDAGDILVMIDSRREEPYVARLDHDLFFRSPPSFMTLPQIIADLEKNPPALVTGDGLPLWQESWPETTQTCPAAADALSILSLASDINRGYAAQAVPLYLRPADVSLPKARS